MMGRLLDLYDRINELQDENTRLKDKLGCLELVVVDNNDRINTLREEVKWLSRSLWQRLVDWVYEHVVVPIFNPECDYE